jgi:hypothetical protein
MVNTVNAGLISPALAPDTRWLALGMAGMMLAGLLCWVAYARMGGEVAPHRPPSFAGRR